MTFNLPKNKNMGKIKFNENSKYEKYNITNEQYETLGKLNFSHKDIKLLENIYDNVIRYKINRLFKQNIYELTDKEIQKVKKLSSGSEYLEPNSNFPEEDKPLIYMGIIKKKYFKQISNSNGFELAKNSSRVYLNSKGLLVVDLYRTKNYSVNNTNKNDKYIYARILKKTVKNAENNNTVNENKNDVKSNEI